MTEIYSRTWGESGERVILLHGSNVANPELTWGEQRPLADRFRLVVVDRRGHGKSPDYEGPGFELSIRDIIELLGEGAHLIGVSYGGVMALLAAGRRPDLVRSLTVIEPPAFRVVRGEPEVEGFLARMAPVYEGARTPEEFMRGFAGALGFSMPPDYKITEPAAIRAVRTAMTEPTPWEAEIAYATLKAATFPKLVLSGNWHPAFERVCDGVTAAMGAEREVIEGADHGVQRTGKPFNDRWLTLLRST